MRIAALVLMFGLTGAGVFWLNLAAPGLSPAVAGSQSTVAGAPSQTSSKLELQVPNSLDLKPDQIATAEVTVTYPKVTASSACAADGQERKQPPKKPPAKKPQATVKKTPKKKGEPSKQEQKTALDKGTSNQAAVAVKFYFDMDETPDYPACTATVTPLIAEPALKPGETLKFPISITSCNPKGGKGTLFVSGNKAQGMAVTLGQRRSPRLFAVLIGGLIVAVLICVGTGKVVSSEGHELSDKMSQVSWDFSSSWASNVTAFGAAFVFLLNLGAFPDKPYFASKADYQFIAAFALALALMAPAIHRLTSITRVVNPKAGDPAEEGANAESNPTTITVGFVGGFLLASAFTIWGTLLQSAAELLIVYELKRAGTLYGPILVVVDVCIALTAVLLMIYCWRGILSTVAANAMRTGEIAPKARVMFQSAPANGNTIARRAISGRKAAVL